MSGDERERIQLVITHCDMLLYNMRQSFDPLLTALGVVDIIPAFHNQFAFMHLVTTMFLVDGDDESLGGGCRKLLEPLGLANQLDAVMEVVARPVGDTTFGDYIRISRNKLGVHGDLTFESLPASIQAVTGDDEAEAQFHEAGLALEDAVETLRNSLGRILATW